MTTAQFKIYWESHYPKSIPLPHFLRSAYNDRWFRIHSLPESKRHPESNAEWLILFERQNKIITDLFGDNSPFLLVTGEYYFNEQKDSQNVTDLSTYPVSFKQLENIDLHKVDSDTYDKGVIFKSKLGEAIWLSNKFDGLLKEISYGQIKTFFISLENECIIAPYDGGIDFILKDPKTKDLYKEKYKAWISSRKDGL